MPRAAKEPTKTKRKAAEGKATKAKATKAKGSAPKRALSAYMFFSQDWRERIKTENPDAGFGEVGKLLGAKWKELDEEDKQPYIELAAKDKARAEDEKASMAAAAKSSAKEKSDGEDQVDEEED
ncbi:hypothetical protein M405DRAFT_815742 [Rhizopogon salebrosus TDB-379]|nr:hypothetical protein M405DRAFT_815742 [Rhizopogon salebrosus TDB-379]